MKVVKTALPGVLIFEPDVYEDARGFFVECFNQKQFGQDVGRDVQFVQDNQSHSRKGVLRGLHYQIKQAQAKLIRTIQGEIYDVAVDLRRSSPAFGKWIGVVLSADNKKQLWVPEGFAHGFLALSESADLFYKVTDYYAPQHQRSLRWNDPALAIDWPIDGAPVLSDRDRQALPLDKAEVFA